MLKNFETSPRSPPGPFQKVFARAAADSVRQLKILLVLLIEIVFVKEIKISPKRYCGSLQVNWRQSYKLSKLEV